MMLFPTHYQRYYSQILLPQFGVGGQRRLEEAKVLIVGLGGLGCPVALYLTQAGVGTLGLVDHDQVEISNLHRQILYAPADVGKNKTLVSKEKLQSFNERTHIETYPERFTADRAMSLLSGYTIIVDASDNFQTRYLINDACVLASKTYVYGSVFQFEGQVSVLCGEGPCYRCLYPTPAPPHSVLNCGQAGVLGVIPGIVGTLQANEVIKLILNQGVSLRGRLLSYDGRNASWATFMFSKNKNCPMCGEHPSIQTLEESTTHCGLSNGISELSAVEFNQLLKNNPHMIVVDVREPNEYELGQLQGAILMPFSSFELNYHSLLPYREAMVIMVCQAGYRSQKAVQFLSQKGFKRVQNLTGGLGACFSQAL